eukprot:SAG31_NODE_2320_length_5943_cov_2.466975_4_plen_511_part_00
MIDSPACRALCASIAGSAVSPASLFGDANAQGCKLDGAPRFRAKSGYGRIVVSGFGRINGQLMQKAFLFQNQTVWGGNMGPGGGILNGYGNAVAKFKTLASAESHTRWRVMSGLLELSSSAVAQPSTGLYAVDVSGVTVAWGAKRGDGCIRLQFPRVPLDGLNQVSDSNQAARLYDIKTPGTWVGASDGPRVTADGSYVAFSFNQHADDNFKVDSSESKYRHLTLLQGNIGSAIELGTYGLGIRANTVHQADVSGVYIHRITQGLNEQEFSQEDNLGSVLGSRTCPFGITLSNITISNVYIPSVGGANVIGRLFALGTYGAPGNAWKTTWSLLDRWFFCDNEWWREEGNFEQKIADGGATGLKAATFENIRFLDWTVELNPQALSMLYNFHTRAPTTFTSIAFYDDLHTQDSAQEAEAVPDPVATAAWPWPRVVRIYRHGNTSGDFSTPCLAALHGDRQGEQCWDGAGQILGRLDQVCGSTCDTFTPLIGTTNSTTAINIAFPYGSRRTP